MKRTALILGITGSLGQALARAFSAEGWQLRALHRHPEKARTLKTLPEGIEWFAGDAMDAHPVVEASRFCQVIVHGVNPPGYRNWQGLALPMLDHCIEAARVSGARILFPGNLYNFGPDAWPTITEESPQNPLTHKGRVRVEMEARLAAAVQQGVRTLILRAGDFFGGNGASAWFENALVKPGKPLKRVTYPGRHDAGHSWAYLPDLAEALVALASREQGLGDFEVFNFGGHYLPRGVTMAERIRVLAGVPDAPIRCLPWAAVRLLGLFHETYRELPEMRYLWDETVRLDNGRLLGLLGEEPHTPLDLAIARTLETLGVSTAQTPGGEKPG